MELTQITKEMHEASKRLEEGSKQLFKIAEEFASAEYMYRSELGKTIVILKTEGMAVTLIPDISRGKCSELKFKRDLTEGRWKAAIKSLEAIETQISALQSILKHQTDI